jgi:polar amino acid transport system permease protein
MPAMFDLINFTEQGWGGALLKGLWMTLQISAGAFVVGLAIGLVVACLSWARPSRLRPWRGSIPRCSGRCRSCC